MIKNINGVQYSLSEGIVIGENFLNKEDFKIYFQELLKESDLYVSYRMQLSKVEKIIHILDKKKPRTTVEFTSDLEMISQAFVNFLGGLGGEISLFTTFNMGKKSSENYFLMKEDDLPSSINEIGEKTYLNSLENLRKLQSNTKNLKKLNSALKSHLNGFYVQLTKTNIQSKFEYDKMIAWSQTNLPDRYKAYLENHQNKQISIGRYFWGGGKIQGYAAEAYMTHLLMMHEADLAKEHQSKLKTVISEHGGPGSEELFELLSSTKGTTSSQLSGDVVIIDSDGKVKYNVQSKASKYGSYEFTITYKAFLQNMMFFLDIYDDYIANPREVENKDVEALFQAFSTKAWVPINKKVTESIDEELKKILINEK